MALFCAIRVTAFVIRAVMIKVESAGENLGLLIGDQILFGIGYAGLLYSGYTLVLDLADEANRESTTEHHVLRLLRSRHFFRVAMATAVTLGIIASSKVSSNGIYGSTAIALREASTGIFLALTALLFLQTIRLARVNLGEARGFTSFGTRHGIFILLLISVFLLVREIFITVTVTPSRHPTQLKAFLVPANRATRNLGRDIVLDTRAGSFPRGTCQERTCQERTSLRGITRITIPRAS